MLHEQTLSLSSTSFSQKEHKHVKQICQNNMSNKTNENMIILKQLLQYQSDVNTQVYIVTIWTNTFIYREFLLKLSQLTRDLSGNTAFNLTKNARVINAK